MNKTWISLIVIALLSLLTIVGYEFYRSISGASSDFVKVVTINVEPDLGTAQLDAVEILNENVMVDDESLER